MKRNYFFVLFLLFLGVNEGYTQIEYDKVIEHLEIKSQAEEFVEDFVTRLMQKRVTNYEIYVDDVMKKIDYSRYMTEVKAIFKANYTSNEAKKILHDNGISLTANSDKKIRLYEPKPKVTEDLYQAAKKLGASLSQQLEEALRNSVERYDGNYSFFRGMDDAYNLLIDNKYVWSSEGDEQLSLVFKPSYSKQNESGFNSRFKTLTERALFFARTNRETVKLGRFKKRYGAIEYPIRKIQIPYLQYKPHYDHNGVYYETSISWDRERIIRTRINKIDLESSPIVFHNKEQHLNYFLKKMKQNLNLKMYIYKNGVKSDSTEYYLAINKQGFSASIYQSVRNQFYNESESYTLNVPEPNIFAVTASNGSTYYDSDPIDYDYWANQYIGKYSELQGNGSVYYKKWLERKAKYIVTKKFGTFEILNSEVIYNYERCRRPKVLLKNTSFLIQVM